MENPIENYWKTRLAELKETLTENNFEVFVAQNPDEAKSTVLEKIIPEIAPKSVSWGGSLTFVATGLMIFSKTTMILMYWIRMTKPCLLKKVWNGVGSHCWSTFLLPEATR